MDIEQAIELILRGQAILFCGAGFSRNARNLRDLPLKTGRELTEYLSNETGLEIGTSLDDAAEAYADKFGDAALIRELQNEYSVREVSDSHKAIAKLPWRRIYTTNYDNVLEVAYTAVGRRLTPITLDDEIHSIPKESTLAVHFNGYVDRLASQKLVSEIKLTESAYATASIVDSQWSTLFRHDIRRADAVVFLGYSLADLDIKRILFEDASIRVKSLFIIGDAPDQATVRRANRFGQAIIRTVDQFADDVVAAAADYQPLELLSILGDSITRYELPSEAESPNDKAVFDLLLLGDVRQEMVLHSLNEEPKYYLKRELAGKVIARLDSGQRFIVLKSELGNGKSMILHDIKIQLHQRGLTVFELKKHSETTLQELEEAIRIASSLPSVFIIEDFQSWFSEIEYLLLNAPDNAIYIFTARTSALDVTIDWLVRAIGTDDITEMSVDRLSERDIQWLCSYFDDYGLWGERAGQTHHQKLEYLTRECHSQFQGVLLSILQSPQIIERYKGIWDELSGEHRYSRLIITIMILTVLQEHVSMELLTDFWSELVTESRFTRSPVIRQLIDFDRGEIKLRSSVAAQHILQNIVSAHAVIDTLIDMTVIANRNSSVSQYYLKLIGRLTRFGDIQRMTPERQRRPEIIRYYESVKNLSKNRAYPLFWLQYGIACTTLREYDRAEKYFSTAYAYARPTRFDTYQIDDHYARFLLTEVCDRGDYARAIKNLRAAHTIVGRQIGGKRNDRIEYPYRIATLYRTLYDTFESHMTIEEIDLLVRCAAFVKDSINLLPLRMQKTSNDIRKCSEAMDYIFERSRDRLQDAH